jgi:hypothetical protein
MSRKRKSLRRCYASSFRGWGVVSADRIAIVVFILVFSCPDCCLMYDRVPISVSGPLVRNKAHLRRLSLVPA